MRSADYWIEQLKLQAHPEGGYFAETYRSDESVSEEALPGRYHSVRNFGTSIYFMLRHDQVSHLHRLQSDELWHFHTGDPTELVLLHADGRWESRKLGANPDAGESLQLVIPRETWFGARVLGDAYTLMGCTVAPGFDFADFELADRQELLAAFPQHEARILRFT